MPARSLPSRQMLASAALALLAGLLAGRGPARAPPRPHPNLTVQPPRHVQGVPDSMRGGGRAIHGGGGHGRPGPAPATSLPSPRTTRAPRRCSTKLKTRRVTQVVPPPPSPSALAPSTPATAIITGYSAPNSLPSSRSQPVTPSQARRAGRGGDNHFRVTRASSPSPTMTLLVSTARSTAVKRAKARGQGYVRSRPRRGVRMLTIVTSSIPCTTAAS